MTYHVVSRWGHTAEMPNEHRLREILAELDRLDPEHPDTWLTHESEWTLTVAADGVVIWENPESTEEPRHQIGVSREKALGLWLKLSRGDIASIEQEPWSPGSCPPRTAEETAGLVRQANEDMLALDRKFYDALGAERPEVTCRHTGCCRGAVPFSAFCRVHHFENVQDRPCPFQE